MTGVQGLAKPVLGPPCPDCGLLALKSQQTCYQIMPECRQFGPAKQVATSPEHAKETPESLHVHEFKLRYVCDCGEHSTGAPHD